MEDEWTWYSIVWVLFVVAATIIFTIKCFYTGECVGLIKAVIVILFTVCERYFGRKTKINSN